MRLTLLLLLLQGCTERSRWCWDRPYAYPPSGAYSVGLISEGRGYNAGPETGLIDPTSRIDGDKLIIDYTNRRGQHVEVTYLISPEGEGIDP